MEFKEAIKSSFVLIGFSGAGKWNGDIVYPIPELLEKSYRFFSKYKISKIVGVCLPPRSDHYFYTCGMEIESVDFHKVEQGMTLHTFPSQKYVVFNHIGHAKEIPNSYRKLWNIFEEQGYHIKKGMPEIEMVATNMFGKEETNEYEMEIWIPIE
ncbi:GyrI-like domain-containing protein [Gracilibacillus lacisalsi]|uniref:GyrI-like domain-containing protein n=1 Tax=Gracilibacillus lacisalsi TaxID=393087 RepID=UPI000363A318|nr:GyrI-like domain-containing protein [Gracilibacillus lacisalsi]